MMKTFKSLRLIFVFVLVLLLLVVARATNNNLFKKDAKTIVTNANASVVSAASINTLTDSFFVVDLREESGIQINPIQNAIHISFEKLLDKKNREILEQVETDILLYSDNLAVATKAWVILSQLNFEQVFIFSDEENPEVFNYKFQPDTSVELE